MYMYITYRYVTSLLYQLCSYVPIIRALHVPTDPGLDGLHDLLVLRRLRQAAGEVHHRDVRCGHAEGHTAGPRKAIFGDLEV